MMTMGKSERQIGVVDGLGLMTTPINFFFCGVDVGLPADVEHEKND